MGGGLYVHIPFCRAKCAYCDFYSGPLRGFDAEAYAAALLAELAARRAETGGAFTTIYIGGGSPGTVAPKLLAPFFAEGDGSENSIELNPDDVTAEYVAEMMRAGVSRVSMGVQSLEDAELRAVGRRHTAADALRAYGLLRRGGVGNVSLDLIYGLPGQTLESWRRSLRGVLELSPEHLSAYSLSYEPGTLLHTRVASGRLSPAPESLVEEMYGYLCEEAAAAGYRHYEISNFALPGMEARHNSSYWDMTPYLGLGPGAHSFDGCLRRFNPPDYKRYMANPPGAAIEEPYDEKALHNDRVMTALRTARGLDPAWLNAEELGEARRILEPAPGGRYRISERDWLIADSLMLPFIRV